MDLYEYRVRRSALRKPCEGLSSQPRLRHHASVMIALSAAMIENASDAYGLDENLDSMHPHALLRGERVRGREQADSVTVVVVAYTGPVD
ncbi:unnamed protein product [Trichogramma brassicae]|uniref:Uncharacterized protein n=1 Tax=Trichogramma brassicae TaxID=86971 RepID=A0A6H5IMH9_9HYME|nr:unnamed protein product [Trichogramma brassicae]